MKKPVKKKKPTLKWLQECPRDVARGALDRAKSDPAAKSQKLHKRVKLVNRLLTQYWARKVDIHD